MKKLLTLIFALISLNALSQAVEGSQLRITQLQGYIHSKGGLVNATASNDTIAIDTIRSRTNNADLFLYGRGTGLVNIEGAYTLPGVDGTSGYLISTNGAGVWGYTDPASITPSGAALTKNDDTNVTLTLGGTPSTALLQATSLTLGWTGNLSVARGGSGAGTFTDGGILYGNGTSAFSVTSAPAGADEFLVSTGAGTWGLESATSARTSLGLGTIATQNATSVNIDGGTIDGTTIGGSTAAAGSFTTGTFSGPTGDLLSITGNGNSVDNNAISFNIGNSGKTEWAMRGSGVSASAFVFRDETNLRTIWTANSTGGFDVTSSLTAGQITSTALTGTGDDILYATSGGVVTRSTVEISSLSSLESGTYVPTITAVTNVSSATLVSSSARYSRNGSVVTVSMVLSVDPVSSSTFSEVDIELPVASSISGVQDAVGTMSDQGLTTTFGSVRGESVDDEARLVFTSQSTSSFNAYLIFQYTIL